MQGEIEDKCGIVGIYSKDDSKDVASFVYYCLYALQHRGQESAGIATFNPEKGLNYYCGMGLITDVFKDYEIQNLSGNMAIGHVRYSTTGQSKLENSQPFVTDFDDGFIAMAHNGDIVNSDDLRDELIGEGYEFKSDTDSEVICYMLKKEHYDNNKDIYGWYSINGTADVPVTAATSYGGAIGTAKYVYFHKTATALSINTSSASTTDPTEYTVRLARIDGVTAGQLHYGNIQIDGRWM